MSIGSDSLTVCQRRIGIVVTGVLLVLTSIWIYFDRDTSPTYPPVPAEYEPILAEHVGVESTLPIKPVEGNTVYSVSVLGEGFVKDRRAQVVFVRSNFKNRPWRQLWVDPQTNRILAGRDWSSANRPRQSARAFDSDPCQTVWSESFRALGNVPFHQCLVPECLAHGSSDGSAKFCFPNYLPDGFELFCLRSCPGGWLQTVFSDGLYAMSLFERFLGGASREHKSEIVVYVWECGLLARVLKSGKELVIVADLPREELEKIARSF